MAKRHRQHALQVFYSLGTASLLFFPSLAVAGSATWSANPVSGDWNNPANWSPATVPNGPDDIATFGVSNRTVVSLSAAVEVNSIVFNPGASAFRIKAPTQADSLTISGTGIVNNSEITQTFRSLGQGMISFTNSATAGSQTLLGGGDADNVGIIAFYGTSNAGAATLTNFGDVGVNLVEFYDASTAANANFVLSIGGGVVFGDNATANNARFTLRRAPLYMLGPFVTFSSHSTAGQAAFDIEATGRVFFTLFSSAGSATFVNKGGKIGALGGLVEFLNNSGAGSATFTCDGSTESGGAGGSVAFTDSGKGESAILIANGGVNGGNGGKISFESQGNAVQSQVKIFGNGTLDVSSLDQVFPTTIGSIEGDGQVLMGSLKTLTIGTNNRRTTFSGVISGQGSLVKDGTGTLTLTGANTYTGSTTVNDGTLIVNNRTGFGTGYPGGTTVFNGILAGKGIVGASVIVAMTGVLSPGAGPKSEGILSASEQLILEGGLFAWVVNSGSKTGNGARATTSVYIDGTAVSATDIGSVTLATGTVFTLIDNTSRLPISGTFTNLPDGGTIVAGSNTFQANYGGGDGNDLTLTVVP